MYNKSILNCQADALSPLETSVEAETTENTIPWFMVGDLKSCVEFSDHVCEDVLATQTADQLPVHFSPLPRKK